MQKYIPTDQEVADWVKSSLHKGAYDSPSRAYKSVGPKKWSDSQKEQARAAISHYFQKEVVETPAETAAAANLPEKSAAEDRRMTSDPMRVASGGQLSEGQMVRELEAVAGRTSPLLALASPLSFSEILAVASTTSLPKDVRLAYAKLLKLYAQREEKALVPLTSPPKKAKRA